jgi:hypothetical protein
MAERRRTQKRGESISKEDLYQNAIQNGLNTLAHQPGLRDNAILIQNKNIDEYKVKEFIDYAERKFGKDGPTTDQQYKEIYKSIENYAASGNFLKDTTKATILDKGLERNTLEKFADFFNPNRIGGVKYFEKARNAYSDMYDLLSQNKLAQGKFPELVEAAQAMKIYGFLDPAIKNAKAHGIMNEEIYRKLARELQKNTVHKSQRGMKGLESFILSEAEKRKKEEEEEKKENVKKIAASIIGFAGLLIMLFNLNITGAAIGTDSTITIGIVGIFMVVFALLLFFRPLKRSFKK